MLVTVFLTFLVVGTYGMPTALPDLSHSCLNMTWACHDLGVAKHCDKFTNCIEIWEKIKAPEDNNEICDICKDMVQQARDQLLSNETQEEMKEVFEGSCNLLPIKAIAAECRKVVDEIVPEIIEMLASRMDPNTVCTVAGLCNNGMLAKLLKEQYIMSTPLLVTDNQNSDCANCKQSMEFVNKALHYIPKKDFIGVLLHACVKGLKGTIPQCQEFMQEVGPIIYNFLRVVGPDNFCGQMNVCPPVKPIIANVGDNMTCEFCEALVGYLKNEIQSPSTKEEFRTALNNFCKDLKEFSDQCKNLVDEYFDQFYDYMVKSLDPPLVCGALGLCNGQLSLIKTTVATKVEFHPEVKISPSHTHPSKKFPAIRLTASRPPQSTMPGVKIQPAFNTKEDKYNKYMLQHNSVTQEPESNSVNEIDDLKMSPLPDERFLHPIGVQSGLNCEVCKSVVSYLEQELKEPKEEDEIKKVLDEVCKVLPQEIQDQCLDFISTNLDYLISMLLKEASPDVICEMLKACPKQNSASFIPCEICRKVMQYLEKELENNKTEEAIREALDKACAYFPKSWSVKCTQFVDQYTDMIIELLAHEVAPTMVCAALGLCPMDPKVEGELECTVCQYVLHYLQVQLMDNATEEEIKAELEKVCSALPIKTLSDNCNAFIEEFGNSLLVLIAQKVDPSVVCVKFKLCSGKGIYAHHTIASETIKSLKMDTCATCQMVVNYMDKLLENDDVDTEITKLIEKICDVIPMSARDQCAALIETYGPFVLQMIGQLSNSKEVCQAVDLCARNAGHVQLLGGEHCTYGPSYWCQSPAHASACNAEPFCKNNVWKN